MKSLHHGAPPGLTQEVTVRIGSWVSGKARNLRFRLALYIQRWLHVLLPDCIMVGDFMVFKWWLVFSLWLVHMLKYYISFLVYLTLNEFIAINMYSLALLKTYLKLHNIISFRFLNGYLHMLFSFSFCMVSALIIETSNFMNG